VRNISQDVLLKDVDTFLCIGAFDGLSHDENIPALLNRGAVGTFVEPVPIYVEALKENLRTFGRHNVIQAAIHNATGEAIMLTANPEFKNCYEPPEWNMWCGSSCLQTNTRNNLAKELGDKKELLQIVVPCYTFADFVRKYEIGQFDYLHIDTEGNDCVVFDQIDLLKHNVRALYVETMWLSGSERQTMLTKATTAGFVCYGDETTLSGIKQNQG